jgi:hypothetical protein
LTIDPSPWEANEQRLVRAIAERVDTTSGDAERLIGLAGDVAQLLDEASSNEEVERLLELVAERQRALTVVRKYIEGMISRTSFLSFVTEQRWSDPIRRRVAALSEADLRSLVSALEHVDVPRIETILREVPPSERPQPE